ncbi:hypothetical protein HPP92_000431 [Vanilla planifolia]|uniref:Uncharacterized protein n=1 Tax=Vanilla planifolia TaxID=51239 RepID=A0A835RY34_VANPL|nr:hypothetical protein HPP92_000452 [Vanilla planifolia]KAG0500359.1 hypothetical protein HPP92_000431 [Vanilla planifolia]
MDGTLLDKKSIIVGNRLVVSRIHAKLARQLLPSHTRYEKARAERYLSAGTELRHSQMENSSEMQPCVDAATERSPARVAPSPKHPTASLPKSIGSSSSCTIGSWKPSNVEAYFNAEPL